MTSKRGRRGQATVEFALTLPILLVLMLGIVDFGRAVAIHAAVVTAAREGARYGVGVGEDTSTSPAAPRYLNCAGIRDAARRVIGGLVTLPNEAIVVTYDRPPSATPIWGCSLGNADPTTVTRLDRVSVSVTLTYGLVSPVALLVPSMTVTSVERRTIMTVDP